MNKAELKEMLEKNLTSCRFIVRSPEDFMEKLEVLVKEYAEENGLNENEVDSIILDGRLPF